MELWSAACDGNTERVMSALSNGADMNYQNPGWVRLFVCSPMNVYHS